MPFMVNSTTPPKLKLFYWKGINAAGKILASKQLAFTETEIREELVKNQIKLIKIRSRLPSTYTQVRNRITESDIHHLTKQLATMLSASIPITQALRLLQSNSEKASIHSLLSTIIRRIESGTSLSEAMRDAHPRFTGIYSDLIEAGETTGKLPELLDRIAIYQQKNADLKKNLQKAMTYPSLVCIVAIAVLSLMLVVVIPEFEDMFTSVNAELPKATRYLLTTSEWFREHFTKIV
ncbi:type II secretion system F family protein [Vibrio hannami]|uniref:type II secretion system F family protein n=1 Tax=Vibrio hannami TaxID=2717094 RepID=UPI00240F13DC|nr:type II secretion system F family protein [Vibrio hannami]MDG3088981.1 type II secretion system F family protein [Vibrio hannami]